MKLEFSIPLFCFLFFAQSAFCQQERILNYVTDIEVHEDRSITVTEAIKVYVSGDVIKRGITRSLPSQRSFNGRRIGMRYKILEVKKNGVPESYHRASGGGGEILYLGKKEILLEPGVYDYLIKYRVPNQIAFYGDYDEIYWNAIGTDVEFEVERALCRVHLPNGTGIIQESAYVGYRGRTEQAHSLNIEGSSLIYAVNRSLNPREGFTVAVGFDKGVIKPPTLLEKYGTLIIILFGLFILFPYYIQTWLNYGQDPPTPASYPDWNIPDMLSSASISYIEKGRYQSKSFTSSVIDLAIKGYLKIEEVEKKGFFTNRKNYDLVRLKEIDEDMPDEEQDLFKYLFQDDDRVSISGKYDSTVEYAYDKHKSSLSYQHKALIRQGNNSKLLVLPILVSIIVAVLSILFLVNSPYAEWLNVWVLLAFVPTALIGLFLYGYLIKKPAVKKLDLRARIKGFKMYLEMTEKDRLNLLNPPELTPEHFEEVLPYAFALGVEHHWTEKFASNLEKMQYQPEWHNGHSPVHFSNNFGRSFTRDLSGSTTQPSKSGSGGGSGGGGFSGGGGGGGGVGGW